jgi:hypothetical protein
MFKFQTQDDAQAAIDLYSENPERFFKEFEAHTHQRSDGMWEARGISNGHKFMFSDL